jgi:ATP/ADP translocase
MIFFLDLFVIFGEVSYICKQIQELNTYFYEGSY